MTVRHSESGRPKALVHVIFHSRKDREPFLKRLRQLDPGALRRKDELAARKRMVQNIVNA
jgi:hypothetical protein